ncbi:MAG: hypothetical protein IT219_09795 [Bacteroidales bacterium]|nr:hypothetical protein [Bacteroidales bacterium]
MQKMMLTFILLHIMLWPVKGQILHLDSLVKITGYLSKEDSCLYFQIENVSDSVLVLNEKNINFHEVRDNEWAADLSLVTSSQSLLQPSFGCFMRFKSLIPKEKYTAVAYNFPLPKNPEIFKLFIQIDYIPVPSNLIFFENILYDDFIFIVKNQKLNVHSYDVKLGIKVNDSINPCKSFFQSN